MFIPSRSDFDRDFRFSNRNEIRFFRLSTHLNGFCLLLVTDWLLEPSLFRASSDVRVCVVDPVTIHSRANRTNYYL